MRRILALVGIAALAGCIVEKSSDSKKPAGDTVSAGTAVADSLVPADSDISTPAYETASLDTAGLGAQFDSTTASPADSLMKRIAASSIEKRATRFPIRMTSRGPIVLQIQILLDRANFSPGIIDGQWGPNARSALKWFKSASSEGEPGKLGADSGSIVDKATYDRLLANADTAGLMTTYEVTPDDLEGPFIKIPENVYEQQKLQCLCFSSPAEELAEKFHTTESLLQQLNPRVKLSSLSAGTRIEVPNVENTFSRAAAPIARLVISKKGFWTHALDSSGRVIEHFPSTLGAGYDPSPTGAFRITGIAHDPAFHYQPSLFAEVPDTKPTARLPAGPNSPVGTVWIALSKPHYGIHGTSSPQTIGYANSHGCVRLTNWDAENLAREVQPNTPVQFQ
ncbi:MAG TPA: L,D-transpeptidase family protein [Gemmatimonadaceae bacterium]